MLAASCFTAIELPSASEVVSYGATQLQTSRDSAELSRVVGDSESGAPMLVFSLLTVAARVGLIHRPCAGALD